MQYSDTNAATLYGIKQDIYYLAHCNALSVSDGDMNRIINKYYGQIQEIIRGINESFYLVVATTDLISGDGSYTYPDGSGTAPGYEKIKSIWASFQPVDPTAPLVTEYERCNIVDADAITDPSYVFSTPTALIFGDYFVLQPLPTSVSGTFPVTDGVKMYYIATLDKLVNDTDIPKIFPSFHDAITQGALIDVAGRLKNKQLKADSEKFFKQRKEEIAAYASTRIPDLLSIVEGQDAQGGWVYPFGQNSMA